MNITSCFDALYEYESESLSDNIDVMLNALKSDVKPNYSNKQIESALLEKKLETSVSLLDDGHYRNMFLMLKSLAYNRELWMSNPEVFISHDLFSILLDRSNVFRNVFFNRNYLSDLDFIYQEQYIYEYKVLDPNTSSMLLVELSMLNFVQKSELKEEITLFSMFLKTSIEHRDVQIIIKYMN
ncbi:hypothetical protein J0X19_22795 [Hymenobacter sp. BT186]|uniref:Uncharacterized protein n=1 Tax=Hymenobacter telluris TaxID=2816474 RepID=A0A939JD24_9BACT|nr:hypothetical protein [Hymenobacter telluris]MBO0360806.1 hypothetical protein [Hymenobacter telluris]MBW3376835.1 hypothetical protein [Hymenobacter norwichensis]